jgi:tetratricopeptide (TPR) repeat protein
MARPKPCLAVLAAAASLAAGPVAGTELRDLHFGEALFEANQGEYFDALVRLDTELAQHYGLDEPALGSLHFHINGAEFSVGDFELNYRMHNRAGRAIRAVLEGDVPEPVRNEAAFRLARIHFQKDQVDEALHALARIDGDVPEEIRDDVEFLRANVYLAGGQPHDAVEVLKQLPDSGELAGFGAYNLGIALLQDGDQAHAIEQLDRAGRIKARERADLAIRDKSNLVLGTMLFESGDYTRAQQTLDRVSLDGPFSNQALLRAGWSEVSAGRNERALVPWSILVDRDPTDPAVQEAMLAYPHAFAELEAHGRAALLYGRALETYSGEIGKVDSSIAAIREGRFLSALTREETRQDRSWVVRLRDLPDSPETFYLTDLMASHDFQTALQNYLDLEDLRTRLAAWRTSFDAFEDIIRLRAANYEPMLPDIDAGFRELDAQMRVRLEQRERIATRLHSMLTAPRPDYLATAEERTLLARIDAIEGQLRGEEAGAAPAPEIERVARLRGALTWRLETEYHARLTDAHEHLFELDQHVDALQARYGAFVRARQAATHSYVGYDAGIARLRDRVDAAIQRVTIVMARQGHAIETVAIHQLRTRRERLLAQQTQARYAVADSYDRARASQPAGAGK